MQQTSFVKCDRRKIKKNDNKIFIQSPVQSFHVAFLQKKVLSIQNGNIVDANQFLQIKIGKGWLAICENDSNKHTEQNRFSFPIHFVSDVIHSDVHTW